METRPSNGQINGHHSTSSFDPADEVTYYLVETAKIIEAWIRKGQEEGEPVCRFTSSKEMRQMVKLTLSDEPCSNEKIMQSMSSLLENSVNPWTGRFVDKVSDRSKVEAGAND